MASNSDQAQAGDGQQGRPTEKALQLVTEPYFQQRKLWPQEGCHILAQYDANSVIVYQAYKHSIAKYAVANQRFGGDDFSFARMSWIKTNFLWMMYRSGWATKKNQECILAVKISRSGFDQILANAYTPKAQREENIPQGDIQVRLQWDPDHNPNYSNCRRRAIQLGLKGEVLRKYATQWIMSIEDVTDFVHKQHVHVKAGDLQKLVIPRERVYIVHDVDTFTLIGLDSDALTEDCLP